MSVYEVGRIVVKTSGREAQRKCVVVDVIDKNYVLISGPKDISGIKRRRANIAHLEPTQRKIEIKKGAKDSAVKKALEEAELDDYMKTKVEISL